MSKSSIEKTKEHERVFLPIQSLEPNSENPNEMSDAEFNLLCDNIEKVGITDPILVKKHPEKEGYYRIVGGHHRWEVAKLYGYEEVPCTVVELSEDDERFQMVRHNVIHGHMSPSKFMKLYESLSTEYESEVAAQMFGFADEEDFKKLIKQTGDSLPPELKQQFDAAKGELKTIDDLSKLLNKLFSQFGDTLPYGYMLLDYGGKNSIWLRMKSNEYKNVLDLADFCKLNKVPLDAVIARMIEDSLYEGMDNLKSIIASLDTVEFGDDVSLPTLDFLDG